MDRARRSLRAALAAMVVMIAPQTAFGDLSAVDLSDLRSELVRIEADVAELTTPADVAALWARLPLGQGPESHIVPVESLFSALPENSGTAPVPSAKGLGVFSDKAEVRAPLDADLTSFRPLLASLAQTYTGKNNQAVINAQGTRDAIALSIKSGDVTLADLRALSTARGYPPRLDGALTLPVVIWPDASLRLAAGERLALARDGGAFLISMGTLEVQGAIIEATGPENPHTPSFTPFVTVMNGGSLRLKGSVLRNLGFGQTPKFGGLSVVGNLLTQGRGDVTIQGTLFDRLRVVSLSGTVEAELSGNTFLNARHSPLNLINAPRSTVRGNLFTGESPTNAIRVDAGSSHVELTDNLFLSGDRVAVLIDGRSDYVQVRSNLVWGRAGAGIKFLRTSCGLAADNLIIDNRQKGIEVRSSDGTVVKDNLIAGNNSAGIWVSAQAPQAQTALMGNILRANGAGLSAATGAEVMMSSNDFAGQLPRLLSGDITWLTRQVAVDLRGEVPFRFKNGQVAQPRFDPLCGSTL